MSKELTGRVALVTGGASGLGRATSLSLAAAGVHVLIADIDSSGAQLTQNLLTAAGGTCEPVELDVTDHRQRQQAIAQARQVHGEAFNILVNVAGIDRPGYLHDVSLADFQEVNAVNYEGPVFLMSEFLKLFPAGSSGPKGEIVNVISLSAITVGSGAVAYNSSKAALAKATEIAQRDALEFQYHCRIQGIMPAAMDTPMMQRWGIPAERMMPPDVVAAEIVHALRRPAVAYGQNLVFTPIAEPDWPR